MIFNQKDFDKAVKQDKIDKTQTLYTLERDCNWSINTLTFYIELKDPFKEGSTIFMEFLEDTKGSIFNAVNSSDTYYSKKDLIKSWGTFYKKDYKLTKIGRF